VIASASGPASGRERPVNWRRLLSAGLLVAACCGIAGGALELWRFGAGADGAARRVEAHVQREFARMTRVLDRVASDVAADPGTARALAAGPDAQRSLFDLLDRRTVGTPVAADQLAVTIYDAGGLARAWTGRPSDIRAASAADFFVTPSPLGLRLVHVAPVVAADGSRLGTVAAEHVLSPSPAASRLTATDWVLPTPLGPASLRMRYEGAGDQPRPNAFVVRAPGGDALVEVSVQRADLDRARQAWRRAVLAVVAAVCGVTLFFLIGPVLDRRSASRRTAEVVRQTAAAVVLVVAGAAALFAAIALAAFAGGEPFLGAMAGIGCLMTLWVGGLTLVRG
jgi:hypothetical protein